LIGFLDGSQKGPFWAEGWKAGDEEAKNRETTPGGSLDFSGSELPPDAVSVAAVEQ
jgi:hypothetical protein